MLEAKKRALGRKRSINVAVSVVLVVFVLEMLRAFVDFAAVVYLVVP
jgi:hypothetical protein